MASTLATLPQGNGKVIFEPPSTPRRQEKCRRKQRNPGLFIPSPFTSRKKETTNPKSTNPKKSGCFFTAIRIDSGNGCLSPPTLLGALAVSFNSASLKASCTLPNPKNGWQAGETVGQRERKPMLPLPGGSGSLGGLLHEAIHPSMKPLDQPVGNRWGRERLPQEAVTLKPPWPGFHPFVRLGRDERTRHYFLAIEQYIATGDRGRRRVETDTGKR